MLARIAPIIPRFISHCGITRSLVASNRFDFRQFQSLRALAPTVLSGRVSRTASADLLSKYSPSIRCISNTTSPSALDDLLAEENRDNHNSIVIISGNSSNPTLNETIASQINSKFLVSEQVVIFFNGSYTNFRRPDGHIPSAIDQAKSIHRLIDANGTTILVYSRITPGQRMKPFEDVYFAGSHSIVNKILKIDRQFLENRCLPIIGHSHGGVLEVLARSKVEKRFQHKIPLLLFGMGAWHLPSFVNALKLLADSASPTFVYFRHEDSLILDRGLKALISDPAKGGVETLQPILEKIFANKNNFIYFTKDIAHSPRDKTAHEFAEYLKRCAPLVSMIGQKNYPWLNFRENLSAPKQLFTDDVTVSLIESWDAFKEIVGIEEPMRPQIVASGSVVDKIHD